MSDEVEEADGPITIGAPVIPSRSPREPLYVGPPEDPDRYELLDDGARGGEGRTWRAAYQGGLNSPLVHAVKMLFPAAPGWPTDADVQRWRDQAALLRHLAQPHVVQLQDMFVGEPPHPRGAAGAADPTVAYLTMEWVQGPTLAAHVRGIPVSATDLAQRLDYVHDIASAVAALHSHTRSAGNPVLHRDLTPANCILHASRGVVLIDITGMRLIEDGFDPLGRHTPAYTAPEVLRSPNEPREPSSDLYAVAAVAGFCLTGEDPPSPLGAPEQFGARVADVLRAAGAAEPDAAAEHLLSMMDADRQKRPTDVLAWSHTLSSLASPPALSKPALWRRAVVRRPVLLAAAVVLAASAGTGVLLSQREDGAEQPKAGGERRTGVTHAPVAAADGFARDDFFSPEGRIVSPTSNQTVRDCEYFTGTADLRPGRSIVTAMHNLNGTDDVRYVEAIFGYDKPESLRTWRGAQYFNENAIGKHILVELIEVPLDVAVRMNDDSLDYLEASRLASQGRILSAVNVIRLEGSNPAYPCEGPS